MPELLQPPTIVEKQPLLVSKRIHVIDALRGFTLFGILVIHSYASFMGVWDTSPDAGNMGFLDKVIEENTGNLFSNTLYSIFSFLFGLSFAIQLQNSLSKGKPFSRKFIWRLIILLLIGYFHSLFFERDILQLYALLGLLLVPSAKLGNKTLLVLSSILFIFSVVVILANPKLAEVLVPLGEFVRDWEFLRIIGLYKIDAQFLSGRLFSTASLFLLGLYVGRKKIFGGKNNRLFKKILYISGVISMMGFIGFKWSKMSGFPESYSSAIFAVERIAQSFFYVALIVRLYRINFFRKILNWLVPAGKMGLSTYIMQSVFILLFFSSNSTIIIRLGLSATMAITCVFFMGQMLFAYWWMSRYRYGPLEWVWRSLTHIKWQPIQKQPVDTFHPLK
jgi:uncharacterized protein